jgi:hypothetical protein
MWTFKAEHKFNDKSSLSGLYLQPSDSPAHDREVGKLFMADQDQWFGPLRRRPHVLVLNHERAQQHDGPLGSLRLQHVAGLVRRPAVHAGPAYSGSARPT